MRITTHQVRAQEIRATHAVRMQVRTGLIINIIVQCLNGECYAWYGSTKKDQKRVWQLPERTRAAIKTFLQSPDTRKMYFQPKKTAGGAIPCGKFEI